MSRNNTRSVSIGDDRPSLLDDGVNGSRDGNLDDDDDDDYGGQFGTEDFVDSLKMATNNKITNVNTWNVHLIEYFYDMNMLRSDDGVSINFQTASTTLDGCTKVISKRVDAVADETNSLLQLLSLNAKKDTLRKLRNDDDDDDDDNKGDGDYEPTKKKKINKKENKSSLTTMDKIKITDKQLEHSSIDPVFRKMLSDFDEGGAKSLLLNALRISKDSRVVVDDTVISSKNYMDLENDESDEESEDDIETVKKEEEDDDGLMNVDTNDNDDVIKFEDDAVVLPLINTYKSKFDACELSGTKISNEIQSIKLCITDMEYGKAYLTEMAKKMEERDKLANERYEEVANLNYDYNIDDFDFNDGNDDGILEENTNYDISQNIQTGNSPPPYSLNPNDEMMFDDGNENYNDENIKPVDPISMEEMEKREKEMMSALDKISNRRSKSHWKIRAFNAKQNNTAPTAIFDNEEDLEGGSEAAKLREEKALAKKRAKQNKNEYVIDFMNDSPETDTQVLFKKPNKNIKLINSEEIRVEETTIPDMKVWNSERLVTSLLKPKRKFRNIFSKHHTISKSEIIADRDFWARKYNDKIDGSKNNHIRDDNEPEIDEDVADFLYDVMDKPNEDEIPTDLPEDNVPDDFGIDNDPGGYEFDAKISTNEIKNETVPFVGKPAWYKNSIQYNKKSKRINIRLLKQNLWDVTKQHVEHEDLTKGDHEKELKLSSIVKDTYTKYQGNEKSELSTSFFFICMLHIANEEGLTIEKTDDLNDVIIHPANDNYDPLVED